MRKSKKCFVTILFILFFTLIIGRKSMAEEDRIIISKNCFLFPIANTDVEMAVEYRKAANGNLRIYNNGPIAPKLMTGNYNWKEQRKEGCDREEHHNGIDITAKDPSNVATNTYDLIAVADGTVIATSEKRVTHKGTSFEDSNIRRQTSDCDGGGYGNYVILKLDNYRARHNGSRYYVYALYGHMYKDSITLKPGNKVEAGTVLGKMGSSGDSGHPHLHFEIFMTTSPSALEAQVNGKNANIAQRMFLNPEDYIQPQILNNIELSKIDVKKENDTTITFEVNYSGLVTINEAPKLEVYIDKDENKKYYPEYLLTSDDTTNNTTKLIYSMPIQDTFDGTLKFGSITEGNVTNKFDNNKKITKNSVTELSGETITFTPKVIGSKGDIDGDGKINTNDLMILKRYLLGLSELTDEEMKTKADFDNDGVVSTIDLVTLKKYLLGKIETL